MADQARTLHQQIRKLLVQLPNLWRGLALVWEVTPRLTLAWGALLVIQGVLPAATVYLTREFVDSLLAAVGSGAAGGQGLIGLAALLGAVTLLAEILRGVSSWIRTAQAEHVRDAITARIHAQAARLDMAVYESPEYYDRLYRARVDGRARPMALLESTGGLVQNGITLLAMVGMLVPYGLWLPTALVVSALPVLGVVVQTAIRQHQWGVRSTPAERRATYYDWLLTGPGSAAEVRLFELGPHFQHMYQQLRAKLRGERLAMVRVESVAAWGASTLALGVTAATLMWAVWRTTQGFFTPGDLALFYQAFNQGQRLTRTLLDSVGQMYSHSLFLGHLFEFLGLEPQVVDPARPRSAPPLRDAIRFEGVTFRYPGSERVALRDFCLTIPAGKVVAIVGPNGAGKSTLVKLLCRFYDPDCGRVSIDGVDVRDVAVEKLRRRITVVFQEPVHYNDTVADNIALGDQGAAAGMEDVIRAARAAGADEFIRELPQGYATLLGRWFADGTELSVGEWQRLALARAFLREASIIALDEPTSAMDSWAETDWMRRFRALAAGRTAIIITHRFTTAMGADVIHVMDEGQVVESGDHQELIALGGRYARSWWAQMEPQDSVGRRHENQMPQV